MIRVAREDTVITVELGESYAALELGALEEFNVVAQGLASAADPPRIVFDLSQTRFVSSRFLEILFQTWNRLRKRQGQFAMCGLDGNIQEVFHVCKLESLWGTYPDKAAAVQALLHGPTTAP